MIGLVRDSYALVIYVMTYFVTFCF